MKKSKNEKSTRNDFLKFIATLIGLFLILYFIHELGHAVMQLFLGIPISLGFYWDKITTMEGMNVLEFPPLTAFALAISGFVATIIPIIYLKRIIFVPEIMKKEFGYISTLLYVFLCIGLAVYDFAIVLILFIR
jgi:hypothetical protein